MRRITIPSSAAWRMAVVAALGAAGPAAAQEADPIGALLSSPPAGASEPAAPAASATPAAPAGPNPPAAAPASPAISPAASPPPAALPPVAAPPPIAAAPTPPASSASPAVAPTVASSASVTPSIPAPAAAPPPPLATSIAPYRPAPYPYTTGSSPPAATPTPPYRAQPYPYAVVAPPRMTEPVHIDEVGRTPESPFAPRDPTYDSRLRSSFASAQGLQGPLDGGWTLSTPGGGDLYSFELVDRNGGPLEGAWRDLRRAGALAGSGFVDEIQRYGSQLTLRFVPPGGGGLATASLTAGVDGRWAGELTDSGERRSVVLRRN